MWNPEYIKIVGIASYKSAKYEFGNNKPRLIQGVNLYDKGQNSNGAGKSIILEGLSLIFFGELIRKTRLVEVIDFEKFNEHYVEYVMHNSITNNKIFIKREFFEKKSPKVLIIENDDKDNPIKKSSVGEYTNYILNDLLKISKEDLLNYFIIQKDKYIPFFSVGDTIKKLIISRFSGSNLIDGIDDDFNREIEKIEGKIVEVEKEINILEGEGNVYRKRLEELNNYDKKEERKKYNKVKIKSIADLKEKREESKNKIIIENKKIDHCTNNLNIYNNRLDILKDIYTEILDIINKEKKEKENNKVVFDNNLKIYNEEKNVLNVKISDFEKILLGEIICPSCEYKFFVKEKSLVPDKIREDLNIKQINLKKILLKIDDTNKEIDSYNEELELLDSDQKFLKYKINQFNDIKVELRRRINEIVKDLKQYNKNIESWNVYIRGLDKNIEITEKSSFNPIKTDIEIEEVNKELLDNLLKNNSKKEIIKEKELEKGKFESYKVIYQRFKTYLANKTIKSIEGFTNYYLQKFNSDIIILIEGYKLLSDNKTIREEIEIKAIREKERTFDSFSNGEKARGVVSNILALQKLINLNCPSGGLNLLILDEIIESTDTQGLISIMFCLEKVYQNIDIITLNSIPNIYPYVVGVCKDKKGESDFIYNKTELNNLLENISNYE